MTKIVQVISDTNIGGAGRYLLNYLKYYDRENFSVSVIIPKDSMLKPYIEKFPEVSIFEVNNMADNSFNTKSISALTKLLKEISPDIVHTHASLSARIAAKRTKVKKIVSTRHCLEPVSSGLKATLFGILNNLLCDFYIAVADCIAQNLKESGISEEKIKTVYNGVDEVLAISDEEKAALRNDLSINEDDFVFGIFARLEKIKGHKYFLKAAREFLKKNKCAKFLVVGSGSQMEDLKKRTKEYGIEKNVIFTGFTDDTTKLLNITDVNVIASESEAMSLAILEAMSLRKPTIATDVGGNSQLVEDGKSGLLVGACDSFSLSLAMLRMAGDSDFLAHLASGARANYEKFFTAEKMVKNLEKLYKEILA